MLTVTFIDYLGDSTVVNAEPGTSLMQVATANTVPGISADCGGACACATCHVYVEDKWLGKLPPPKAGEEEMLAFVEEQRDTSRLACQITLDEKLDGLVVHTPENQG
ncbi:MAG: 2Fe-2S iron-sulfur cluster-binding protein [Porticoccaceae bacterium]|jgi:2Fe-2S ferredoxin|nr:2Fe-2S iron-sulfur cluster-binding protein [Porticoccaceae bacterium]